MIAAGVKAAPKNGGAAVRMRGAEEWMRSRGVTAAVVLMLMVLPAAAQPASPFDGTWLVVFTCPATPGGTAGYTRRFQAAVRGGVLHGEFGGSNQAGSLVLDGTIQPDGAASLTGRGFTGDPGYSAGRPDVATPYIFHLRSQFARTTGSGSRVEVRRCDATFTKQ